MKKIVAISFLLMFSLNPVFSEIILAPQWSEFFPVEYLNAQSSRWNKNNDYWFTRRNQFEEAVSKCNVYTGEDLKSCYSQIRSAEQTKNKAWSDRLEQQKIESQKSTELYNRMQTFDAINHLIDTIGK